jgi:hypothetical protein
LALISFAIFISPTYCHFIKPFSDNDERKAEVSNLKSLQDDYVSARKRWYEKQLMVFCFFGFAIVSYLLFHYARL